MRLAIRLLQRAAILGLGVLSVWLIVDVFEWVDRRLPWVLALVVTYGFGAYLILPRAVRMGLKILQRKHVPSFTITGDGLPGDPVNLALVGTFGQLRIAFATAGWVEADPLSVRSSWGMARAFVFNTCYPTAPFILFIFLDVARTSVFKRQSMIVLASDTIFAFGRKALLAPRIAPGRPVSG